MTQSSCQFCGAPLSPNAEACPACGQPVPSAVRPAPEVPDSYVAHPEPSAPPSNQGWKTAPETPSSSPASDPFEQTDFAGPSPAPAKSGSPIRWIIIALVILALLCCCAIVIAIAVFSNLEYTLGLQVDFQSTLDTIAASL